MKKRERLHNIDALFSRLRHPKGEQYLYSEEFTTYCQAHRETVIPLLIEKLCDENENVRHEAVRGLWLLKDRTAVSPLISVLQRDPCVHIRQKAVRALCAIGDYRAVSPLLDALQYDEELTNIFELSLDIARFETPEVVDYLLTKLQSGMILERWYVVRALIDVIDKRIIPILLTLLQRGNHDDSQYQDVEEAMRADAAVALGKWGNQQDVFSQLVNTLLKDSLGARIGAAIGLGNSGNASAVPYLMEILHENVDEKLRYWAAVAIGKLGDNRTVQMLLDIISNDYYKYNKPYLVIEAIHGLANLHEDSSIPLLLALYTDTESTDYSDYEEAPVVNEEIIKALIQITRYDLGDDIHEWYRWWLASQ